MPRMRVRLFLFVLAGLSAELPGATKIAPNQPVINFRLSGFTPEGNRDWVARGSEGRYLSENDVHIKELNLTLFNRLPESKVETSILSPSAQIRATDMVARGDESIRVINERFDATGSGWVYEHKDKKVSISRNVHLVLHAQLGDILK